MISNVVGTIVFAYILILIFGKAMVFIWRKLYNRYTRISARFETVDGAEQLGFESMDHCYEKLVQPVMDLIYANNGDNFDDWHTYCRTLSNGIMTWVVCGRLNCIEFFQFTYNSHYRNIAVLKDIYILEFESPAICLCVSYIYKDIKREIVFNVPFMTIDQDQSLRHRIEFDLTVFPIEVVFCRKADRLPKTFDMTKVDDMNVLESVKIEQDSIFSLAHRYGFNNDKIMPDRVVLKGRITALAEFDECSDGYGFVVVTVLAQGVYVNLIVNSRSLRKPPLIGHYCFAFGCMGGTQTQTSDILVG